jgi:6-phospho-3-hexuloisomerase
MQLTQPPFSYNLSVPKESVSPQGFAKQDMAMDLQVLVETILDENEKLLRGVPQEAVDHLIEELDKADRVFCAAQGRSGFVLRCFCMRLMQLGYSAFFVGETITPGIRKGDMLFVVSGSGQTGLTQEWIRIARERGAITFGIVGAKDSPIGRAVHSSLSLPAGPWAGLSGKSQSVQPPGSLFEQAAFALLETIVLTLYQRQGSDPEAMRDRHANLQ